MAFIDEVKLDVQAGKGGDGVVRWRREKAIPFGGPYGGNGGKGGDVYIEAVRDVHALAHYRNKKEFQAENGGDGGTKLMHGKNGEDLILPLPVGSIVRNLDLDITYTLIKEGAKILILHGGGGGLGNNEFKNATNRTPKEYTKGKRGEYCTLQIELQLIASVGLVGLPNAGKSSLLNALTRASAKTADYPFTTLEPNLGEMNGYILADIPGLIEGASEGKGLGHKFLKHIKRTELLVHLVSAENEDIAGAYKTIQNELAAFDESLVKKQELVLLSKIDAVDEKTVQKKLKELKRVASKKALIFSLSLYDDKSVKEFKEDLTKILEKK